MKKEFIICAANHHDDGKEYVHQPNNITSGFVICGRRHHNCFATLSICSNSTKKHFEYEEIQGFITSTNRFVDRIEAGVIALASQQITKLNHPPRLFSEDLY